MRQPSRSAPATALERFAVTAKLHPGRIAVRADDGTVTFDELRHRAAALAGALRGCGVGPGDVVGVRVGRSVRLPIVLLAVWHAGAAYMPLDPAYPAGRLATMCADAGVAAVVSGDELGWAPGVPVISPDETSATGEQSTSCGELAYVIYTSGSSGSPKGVEVTHTNLAGLIDGLERAGAYPEVPRTVAWNASASFDASVQQWVRIVRGDTVVVIGDNTRLDSHKLAELLRTCAVTDLDLTPSHWPYIRTAILETTSAERPLRLFVGGEPMPPFMWREISAARERGLSAFNLYGPTEGTVDSTIAIVDGTEPHIGAPVPGVNLYLLDDAGLPVPDGAPGEIYLGGRQIARGYRNNAALTAQRFTMATHLGDRVYRTGDLAQWSGSVLHFLGRADRQLKVGGYRVEPEEVERVLLRHPRVARAAVTTQPDVDATPTLVAFVVPASWDESSANAEELALRDHCATFLPSYMLPAAFRLLRSFPLTDSGKVDYAALPTAPTQSAEETADVQQVVSTIWQDLLGQAVSPDDNFFALGGHSLLAVRAVSRVKQRLGVDLSISDIYEHPSLAEFAAVTARSVLSSR